MKTVVAPGSELSLKLGYPRSSSADFWLRGAEMRKLLCGAALVATLAIAQPASAAVTLNVVDSFARSNAFGLAYDGSNIWWSNSSGTIYQMTTAGMDTGIWAQGPYWSALAYNNATSKLVVMQGANITSFDRPNAAGVNYASLNPTTTSVAGGYGGLVDGLDVQGSTLWWSPDVDKVYYSPVDGSGARTEFLGGAGGYSGVEYLTVGGLSYILVVNDASNPRRLCIHLTDATEVGCSTLPNSRYEDLAFDGRYLYAADFYGHRIDKIDILVDGGSIFNPPGAVPEPGTWTLLVAGFLGLGTVLRRRRLRIVA
jgi:hypothetical protein